LTRAEGIGSPHCCGSITLVIGTRAGSRPPVDRSTAGRSAVELHEPVGSEGRCRPCCGDLMRVAWLLSPSPHRWQGVEPARAKPGLSFKGWPLTVRAHRYLTGAPWRFRPAFRALKERDP